MAKQCDNKSVGIILRKEDSLVCIERFNYPQAVALPAGHADGDTFERAARKEMEEEVGAAVSRLDMVWEGRIDNPCKREGGSFHEWEVYETSEWSGELRAGSDAKRFFLATSDDLKKYAGRSEYFMEKYSVSFEEVGALTIAIFGDPKEQNTDPEWIREPGLEPVWNFILKQLGYI